MPTPQVQADLEREVARLTHRLRGVGPAWFAAHARPGDGPTLTRAEILRALAQRLAALGARAGSGAPPGVALPALADHALADQLMVLTHDVLAAPDSAGVLTPAVRAVREARGRVESVGAPDREG